MKRVLLIVHSESEAELDHTLAAELESRGDLEIVTVEHGLNALVSLAQGGFHLVIIHIREAFRDGVALAFLIRERKTYRDLPVIAVAPTFTCSEHGALRMSGIDHVLTLPSAPTVIRRCLDEALNHTTREPGVLERLARACDPAPSRIAVYN